MAEQIKEILMIVLNYFWEIFKYWGIIPEDTASDVEDYFETTEAE